MSSDNGAMNRDGFVTREFSIALDLVRGLAALVVLVGHSMQFEMYTGPWPFTVLAQHNAVIVFFVLSGLVIATSVTRKRPDAADYAAARANRVLPVAIAAVVFSTLAFASRDWIGDLGDGPQRPLGLSGFAMPLLFMSESPVGAQPYWNAPYWSLVYEVWFYAIFGAAVFLRGGRRTLAVALLMVLAGPRVLLLLPVWLTGVWLAHRGHRLLLTPQAGARYLAASIIAMIFITDLADTGLSGRAVALAGLAPRHLGIGSEYFLTDYAMGLAVAAAFVGLRALCPAMAGLLNRAAVPAKFFAAMSFTLYLFHWPILCVLKTAGFGAGNSLPGFIGIIGLVVIACAAIALVTERPGSAWKRLVAAGVALALHSGSARRARAAT